ncbi:MAG: pentapeptide repeat-containing protein [Theionarchaea archaeon]|nr:pentapeptide repeat-containing protein [Theionarchaea archaeon]
MEKCSYTWNEWNEEKGEFIKNQCSEEIWKNSKKYCIFHDPFPGKDLELFEQKLQKKIDSRDYNFRGFYFSGNVDFSSRRFEEDACFDGATFKENAYFNGAHFQNAYFNGVTFKENAYFNGAHFTYASFFGAVIERDLEFVPNQIVELNLQNVRFLFKGHVTADLTKAKFHRGELENVAFTDCIWPEKQKIYEESHMIEEGLSFKELETIYRNLKQNMQRHGDYSKAGDFYYKEMEMRKKQYTLFTPRWWGQNILHILCGYGEKPFWVIRNSLFIILMGAILFFFCGVERIGTELPEEDSVIDYSLNALSVSKTTFLDFGYCIYYSVVTFTTLGYGDIHPLGLSHIFASLEAFTGAFFMALFVLVFGRKMMR